ncbi:hypothetical protein RI129_002442 [Pyrocoelia pectoralis]|uniref:Uncharacterized protein n=1 Tax=Pyrocoelia pectoralis TaxID=417401 RepID=A0AAN7VG10_9COLE
MKSPLVILLLCVSNCLCQIDNIGWPNPDEKQCLQRLSLDEKHIGELVMAYAPGKLPDHDEDFSKFVHCRGIHMGIQNESGELNFENLVNVVKYFPEGIFNKNAAEDSIVGGNLSTQTVENCKKEVQGDNAGQTLIRMQNCIDNYLVKHFNS